MTIRLYFDEDSSDTALIEALRLRSIDVVGAAESDMIGRNDAEQLRYATQHDRALYSFNRGDFYRIHGDWMRARKTHSGIILAAQQRYSVGEQLRRLVRLLGTLSAEDMTNRIEFLSAWG